MSRDWLTKEENDALECSGTVRRATDAKPDNGELQPMGKHGFVSLPLKPLRLIIRLRPHFIP